SVRPRTSSWCSPGPKVTGGPTSNGKRRASPRRWSSRSCRRATPLKRWRRKRSSTPNTTSRNTTSTTRRRIISPFTSAKGRSSAASDGRRFLTFPELEADRARQLQLRLDAEKKLQSAEQRFRRLPELSGKLRRGQATPEEIAELEGFEKES